jgi:uncharacterized protein (DUF2336 family)
VPKHLIAVVSQVEAAVSSKDAAHRVSMLRKMTQLFGGSAAQLSESQIEAFGTIILKLTDEIETEARVELAEQMSNMSHAPRAVVRDLALDHSPLVASPVLERSTRVEEDVLVEVARERSQQHLMALSRRQALTTRVTDHLIERGDGDVVRSVAGNTTAAFSPYGHSTLVERAAHDDVLRSRLVARVDIPPAYRNRLVSAAKARARANLEAEFGAEAVAGAVSHSVAGLDDGRESATLVQTQDNVEKRLQQGELDEATITEWLRHGKEAEALIALARKAGVPQDVAFQAYEAESYEPLLFLIRSVNLGWRILKLFMMAKDGRTPAPEVMQGALEAYQALSIATAQRVVRFTVARGAAQTTSA